MLRKSAQFIGLITLGLGISGLLLGEGILASMTNIDITLDLLRVFLSGVLLYVGFAAHGTDTARGLALGSGVAALGFVVLSLISRDVFGLVTSNVTNFDIAWNFVSALLLIWNAVVTSDLNKRPDGKLPAA